MAVHHDNASSPATAVTPMCGAVATHPTNRRRRVHCLINLPESPRRHSIGCTPPTTDSAQVQFHSIQLISSFKSLCQKILEKIIHTQLASHLESKNLLYIRQSGFRPIHSTHTALQEMADTAHRAMDKGKIEFMVFFFFLDMVHHPKLLSILVEADLSDTSREWFRNYLSPKGKRISDLQRVVQGVPTTRIKCAYYRLKMLFKFKYLLLTGLKVKLCDLLVLSVLNYCCGLFICLNKKHAYGI
ncbi:hypothetical protein PR048_000790 [Dryococelus australis]|uniref:Reverse transcriptase domain-containing protein n=1 Tax=Dryococelus australis TaxID=614101 RepID=A0ABQ9IFL6_9NEOP|nr:hypothetical protein PR048_000790 [Dryococelus australis]